MKSAVPLLEQIKSLNQMQVVDLRIDTLKKDQQALPIRLKGFDESLAKLSATLKTKDAQREVLEKIISSPFPH